jgi:hypothetical protein
MFKFLSKKKSEPSKRKREILLKEIYRDKEGRPWYEYANPLTLPAKRAIAAEVASRYADLNLTRKNLLLIISEMKKKANEGNIVEVFNLLSEIEYRTNFLAEEETLTELSLVYFVAGEEEDETNFSDIDRNRKVEIFKRDPEAKDFFLRKAWQYTIRYSDTSDVDILAYLKENLRDVERLSRLTPLSI